MRLICPNCDAEYQVDDAAIPEGGRDVQCSNCGHAWFQLPADMEMARDAGDAQFGMAPEPVDAGDAQPTTPAPPEPEPVFEAPVFETPVFEAPVVETPEFETPVFEPTEFELPASEPPIYVTAFPETLLPDLPDPDRFAPGDMPGEADDAIGTAAPLSPLAAKPDVSAPIPLSRQTLAESVLSVLREEAARETAVRREEDPLPTPAPRGVIETQTEFGLDDAGPGMTETSAAARHIARLKGDDADMLPAKAAARRDLLPDIEEINSTLRANSDREDAANADMDAASDTTSRRRGFRSGFVLMMIFAVALAMGYVMAPRIVAQIPGSAGPMMAYVSAVDQSRIWLDGVMKAASGSLRSFSGDGN